jgi:hypothetical protein
MHNKNEIYVDFESRRQPIKEDETAANAYAQVVPNP